MKPGIYIDENGKHEEYDPLPEEYEMRKLMISSFQNLASI